MALMTNDISHFILTDKGNRKINEDACGVLIKESFYLYVLCDGLGGHGNGDVASQYVVERIKDYADERKSIEESIMLAQQDLLELQHERNLESSMKTTLACLVIENNLAKFAYVGDSRIYYFEKGKYRLRSKDHSIPQMLVNSGVIKEKDIRHHEDRSRLLRVMGTEWNEPKYQVVQDIEVTNNTSFLLCSDGFWECIDEKSMSKTLKKVSSPKEWLENMESIVLKNGEGTNMDNYSAIAVFVR